MNPFKDNPALSEVRQTFLLTHLISHYDDLKGQTINKILNKTENNNLEALGDEANRSIFSTFINFFKFRNSKEWILLTIYAVLYTIFMIFLEFLMGFGLKCRYSFLEIVENSNYLIVKVLFYILFIGSGVIFGLISASMGVLVSPGSDGSGIPELKIVLAGMNLYQFYDFNTFIGKTCALVFGIIGGYEIGLAANYVHIAGLFGKQLLKIKYFESIKSASKRTLLVMSATLGITAELETPLGGILFAIEQSSTVFLVANILKCFYVAVLCMLTKTFMRGMKGFTINFLEGVTFEPVKLNFELLLFIVLAVICGLFSAFYNIVFGKLNYSRRMSKNKYYNNRFYFVGIVGVVCALISISFPVVRESSLKMFSVLFKPNYIGKTLLEQEKFHESGMSFNLSNHDNISSINDSITNSTLFDSSSSDYKSKMTSNDYLLQLLHPNEGTKIFILIILKFILIMISNTANMPNGLVGPTLLMGTLTGRLFGHIVYLLFDIKKEYIFSACGAACFLAGSTHSIAPVIIVYEMTGDNSYLIHLIIATLISNVICQRLSVSLYDIVVLIRNLPHIGVVKSEKFYGLTVNEIKTNIGYYLQSSAEEKDRFDEEERGNNTEEMNFDKYSTLTNEYRMKNKFILSEDNNEDIPMLTDINFNVLNIISSINILMKIPPKFYFTIPIIDKNNYIQYTITPKKLFFYVVSQFNLKKSGMSKNLKSNLTEVIEHLKEKFLPNYTYFIFFVINKFKLIYNNITGHNSSRLDKLFKEESLYRHVQSLKQYSVLNGDCFLNDKLDVSSSVLEVDYSYISLESTYSLLKLQYFFTFLSVSHVFIVKKGRLVGIVGKEDFIKGANTIN